MLSATGLAQWFARGGDGLFGPAPAGESGLRPETRTVLATGREVPPARLAQLRLEIARLAAAMADLFAAHDVMLTPATAALPWDARATHPARIAGQAVGPRGHAVFTAFANAAGLPAVALPCGWVDGLPAGLQLVGRRGDDARVLALGLQYEQAGAVTGRPAPWPHWSMP